MEDRAVPVNTPYLQGNEEAYLVECVKSGWISSEGPFVRKFEEEFAAMHDRKFGVALSNGSAALDVSLKALGISSGDEVIVPTFTIISPVQSIVTQGATPVLVDSDLTTWNMNVQEIEAKITERTKAILVVHIYGLPVDMDPILHLCSKYQLALIEDAAEMHGQTYRGRLCGSFGLASTFSFYPNKHITTGEGGMVLTDDEDFAEKCRQFRNLAFMPNKRRFVHEELGWNYRMTNLQAALGLAQLENIDEHVKRKRSIGNRYLDELSGISELVLPLRSCDYAENIYWVFGMLASSEERANELQAQLREKKIGTRPFFWCMHEQPVFKKMGMFEGESYPNAEHMARTGFYIPSGLGLTEQDMEYVVENIRRLAK